MVVLPEEDPGLEQVGALCALRRRPHHLVPALVSRVTVHADRITTTISLDLTYSVPETSVGAVFPI